MNCCCFARVDWDDSQTDLAHLGGAAPGAAKSGGDKLWEDNWDDDDVDSDPETGGKARQRALKILKARNEMPAAGEHIITLFRGHPQMELTWGPGCRHVEKFGLKQTA